MNILLATSELHPFSKTGGLADMVAAFSKALSRKANNVFVITPQYRGIKEKFGSKFTVFKKVVLPLGNKNISATINLLSLSQNLYVIFVEQDDFYDRDSLYQQNGVDYPDNPERFIFFSKCVVDFAMSKQFDLIHIHDWQTGLVPLFVQHLRKTQKWLIPPPCVITVHNLAFQGIMPRSAYELTNLPYDYFVPDGVEYYGNLNCLKAGIVYSDKIITVSPRYAREITTSEFGCGLDGVLRWRQQDLIGILNGVDYDEWNPETDQYIPERYSKNNLHGKKTAKKLLQQTYGLPVNDKIPLFACTSRLTHQKGIDLLIDTLKYLLIKEIQFVLLGKGEKSYEAGLLALTKNFPEKISVKIGFDVGLSHLIEAGSDFFVMPSRFEPCGLNQMYSLRYGTIPIVRRVGGLDDSVIDITDNIQLANGIKFSQFSVPALAKAFHKAIVIFETPKLLAFYRYNGMSADFSWERAVEQYLKVYKEAIEHRRRVS